jgi:RNA polymerase sigma-70 factor (ECF subfamily)
VTASSLDDVFARLEPGAKGSDDTWSVVREHLRTTAARFVAREDVDDVVQTVLLKLQAPGALRRVRAAGSPGGYLAVMLRNAFVDLVRQRQAHGAAEVGERADDAPSQSQRLEETERSRRLAAFAARLSEADRELLRLRYWSDLSIAEIAGLTGMKYSAVAVRLFRILGRLRSRLGPDRGSWR